VTDFGLARSLDGDAMLTSEGAVLGTPAYMAPEQALGQSQHIGPWTDLYSVGVILCQLLTGRLPREGSGPALLVRVAYEGPPAPSSLRPGLDPALEAVILKSMATKPEDRFQTAHAFREALIGWSAMSTQPTVRQCVLADNTAIDAAVAPRTGKGLRARLIPIAVVALLLAAGIYAVGPSRLQRWVGFQAAEETPKLPPQETKEDREAREQARRKKLGDDGMAHIHRTGQAIASRAYPFAIGGVIYENTSLQGVTPTADGHEVNVKVNYSNALHKSYFLEIVIDYDATDKLRSWRLLRHNDPFPPSIRGKTFDRWLE
jgi:hypothetical protein